MLVGWELLGRSRTDRVTEGQGTVKRALAATLLDACLTEAAAPTPGLWQKSTWADRQSQLADRRCLSWTCLATQSFPLLQTWWPALLRLSGSVRHTSTQDPQVTGQQKDAPEVEAWLPLAARRPAVAVAAAAPHTAVSTCFPRGRQVCSR